MGITDYIKDSEGIGFGLVLVQVLSSSLKKNDTLQKKNNFKFFVSDKNVSEDIFRE